MNTSVMTVRQTDMRRESVYKNAFEELFFTGTTKKRENRGKTKT